MISQIFGRGHAAKWTGQWLFSHTLDYMIKILKERLACNEFKIIVDILRLKWNYKLNHMHQIWFLTYVCHLYTHFKIHYTKKRTIRYPFFVYFKKIFFFMRMQYSLAHYAFRHDMSNFGSDLLELSFQAKPYRLK